MSAFHQQNWNQRVTQMGDVAENICDIVHDGRTHALGLNRVWQNGRGLHLTQMTPAMRYTPDRMTIDAFIECMGVGRDRKLKIKDEKLAALAQWDALGPVRLGVYDQHNHVWYEAPIRDWIHHCNLYGHRRTFPEGKGYRELHVDNFPSDPIEIPDHEAAA